MRRLFAIGFSALLAAGVVAILVLNIYSGRPGDAEQRAQRAAKAVTVLLTEQYDLDLETLTAGRELGEGHYDFRGALAGDLRGSAPIYGIVELTCDSVTSDPGCWRLVTFEKDGEVWSPAAAARSAQAEAEIAAEREDEAAQAAAGGGQAPATVAEQAPAGADSGSPEGEADSPAGAAEVAAPETEAATAAPEARDTGTAPEAPESADLTPETPLPPQIFAVTSPVVNGRAGPGTEHSIVMKVTPEFRLELIERRENWGRFRVVEGSEAPQEEGGVEPWIWLQLVERRNTDNAS